MTWASTLLPFPLLPLLQQLRPHRRPPPPILCQLRQRALLLRPDRREHQLVQLVVALRVHVLRLLRLHRCSSAIGEAAALGGRCPLGRVCLCLLGVAVAGDSWCCLCCCCCVAATPPAAALQSVHRYLLWQCPQIALPPHCLHLCLSRPHVN